MTVTEYHVLVADTGNHAIRNVMHDADTDSVKVTTLAGTGLPGRDDSRTRLEKPKASVLLTSILEASFALPTAVACGDTAGGALVADTANHRVRQIRSDGVTVTVAGGENKGMVDGDGTFALFDGPAGITRDSTGTRIIIADRGNAALRNVYLNSEALQISAGGRAQAARRAAAGGTTLAAALLAAAMLLHDRAGRRRHA